MAYRITILRPLLSLGFIVGGSTTPSASASAQGGTSDTAAAAVIEDYISALGGRAAFATMKTLDVQQEREQFGTVTKTYRIEDLARRRFYQRADSPDGMQETGFDGTRVWQKRAAFHGYLGDDEVLTRTTKNPEPDIRDYRESGRVFSRLPNETVDGKEYIVLRGTQHQVLGGDVPVKFFFDPTTHLLRRRSYGNVVQVVQAYDDYRTVDGVLVPFRRTVTQPQGTTVTRTILERHNVPIADSLFEYREKGAPIEPPAGGAAVQSRLSDSLRLATFEYVWRKVNETFWDSTFNGVDWSAIHERYRPRVLAAAGSRELHDELARMVAELRVSHFHVRPPEAIVNERTTSAELAARPNAGPRIGVRFVNSTLFIDEVDSSGPGAKAGLRPGYIIERIDGKTPQELYGTWKANSVDFELPRLGRVYSIEDALRGPASRVVALDLVDENGQHVRRSVQRVQPELGLGRQFVFESRRLAPDVGYIHWSVFFNDAVERFRGALDSLRTSKGLIIDLRGNPGGVGAMARAIASNLFKDSASLGVARFRRESQNYSFAGTGARAYRGKVVILVDGHSGSTSEVLAAGLQDLGRAIVVGDTSAGAVLPSNAEQLPSGGSFQHPISDFHSPKGFELEGRGVIPDIVVVPTRKSMLAGRDIVLDRAIEILSGK